MVGLAHLVLCARSLSVRKAYYAMPKRRTNSARAVDPNGFLRIYTTERRFGYYTTQSVVNTRVYTDYNPSTGNVSGSGTIGAGTSLPTEKSDRTGKSSNKPYRIKSTLVKGRTFRNPSNYRRTIARVDYFDGSAEYRNSEGKLVRRESGRATVGPNGYGPNIGNTLSLSIPGGWIAKAETQVLLKLKDQKIDIGTALAESRQTIAHLAHTAKSLLDFAIAVKKGRWTKAAKALGLSKNAVKSGAAIGNRWLEYRFAWLPLMSDVHGAMEELKRGFREEAQLFSATRMITENVDLNSWFKSTYASTYSLDGGWAKASTRVKIYARVSDSELQKLTSIGLLNPLQVAWELVPFSFVLDWFLPVGEFLEALDATRGLTFVGGARTTRVATSHTILWKPSNPSGTTQEGYRFRVSGTSLDRQKYSAFPWPNPFYLKSPFSTTHLLDALALVRQAFGTNVGRRR